MKTIRLYGDIAKSFRTEWQLDVQTPGEALRAINANRPGFYKAADKGGYIALLVDESRETDNVHQVNLDNALDQWGDEVLIIVPRVEGEVTAAVLGSLAGALVGSSSAGVAAAGVFISTYAGVIAIAANLAISIAISSVAAAIQGGTQGDGPEEAPENKPSYLFNGVVNTTRQGHRVPVLYGGPLLVGSMVLSSRVNTKDIEV